MAFIPTNAAQVQQFAGALYGITAGTQTMAFVLGEIQKASLDQVLNTYFTASFGKSTTAAVAQLLVRNLGISETNTEAVNYVNGLLTAAPAANRGATVKDIIATFVGLTADATYGAAARAWTAKVDAALAYSGVADIPFSPATNPALPNLTVGQDVLTGSAGDDVFVARVVQNSLGHQTNTLGTGDVLNGGAGADALLADVVMAATLESMPMSPIRPETRGIEFAHFTALEANAANNQEAVLINAAKMHGLSRVGSVGSDASLTIYNLTTLTDSGAYSGRRNTSAMTVLMDHTGNDSAFNADVESDMTVLFDQNYLVAGRSTRFELRIDAVNVLALRLNKNPLDGISKISFKVAGKTVVADLLSAPPITTYEGLKGRIEAALRAENISDVSVEVVSLTDAFFSITVDEINVGTFVAGSFAGRYNPIRLTSSSSKVEEGKTELKSDATDSNYANSQSDKSTASVEPVTINVQLHKVGRGGDGGDLTIGAMSTAENLPTSPDSNSWNSGSGQSGNFSTSAKQGIEVFNVEVVGDETQPSDLASLQSTNNALRTVKVTAATGAAAGLIIGNRETDARSATINGALENMPRDLTTFRNAGLKDVKDFNAAGFNNGVELHAHVSDESVAKYMNRTDRAPDLPAADNAAFVYSFGSGSDTLNINISKQNLTASGTTNRENFTFSARAGAGNDTVLAQIGDGTGSSSDIWWVNHVALRNISIDGGAGNDTIRTYGSSAWSIVAGDGDDTVYTDNSGAVGTAGLAIRANENTNLFNSGRAVWVLADNRNIVDLRSTGSALGNKFLYGARVNVVLSDAQSGNATSAVNGFESTVPVSTSNGVGNQLHINQAIKLAVNSNAVLNKLIIAEDGPGNTLVIRALIDGSFSSVDLVVRVIPLDDVSFSAYTTTQQAEALEALRVVKGDINFPAVVEGVNKIIEEATSSAALLNGSATSAGYLHNITPRLATQTISGVLVELTGADSLAINANRVNPGPGDDVIVLSTDTSSRETIIYTGSSIGNDVIVNFFNDTLNFDSYLTNVIAATGARVPTTFLDQYTTAGVFDANNVVVTNFTTLNAVNPATNLSFAELTADQVLGELRASPAVVTSPVTPTSGFTTAGVNASIVPNTPRKAVLMVQNDNNSGLYQVYELQLGNAGGGEEFTSAVKLGSVDFGQQLVVSITGVSRLPVSDTPDPLGP